MFHRSHATLVLLVVTVLGGAATRASAGVPDPNWSIWPRHVDLVGGNANGVPDPAGRMHFEFYRVGGTTPSGGAALSLDFVNVTGITVCQDQKDPNVAVICDQAGLRVRAFADVFGKLDVTLMGHANHAAGGSNAPSLNVYVDGVFFGTVPVAAYDEDGNGLGPADNSLWQADYFSGQYWERSDLDGDGTLGPNDLSQWLTLYFADGSLTSCAGAVCP